MLSLFCETVKEKVDINSRKKLKPNLHSKER